MNNIQIMLGILPVFGGHDVDVTGYLPVLAGWSSVLGIVVALLMILISWLSNRRGGGTRWNVSGQKLTSAFAFVWLAGFIIYDVGMYIGHSSWSLLTNVPMAIVHAFDMFLLDSDVCAIHSQFHDNWIFMGCFSLVHMLAAVISLVFVLKHFGFNIIASARMQVEACLRGPKRDTFVFLGLNEASFLLARNIAQHYGDDGDYRIIIVRTNHANDADGEPNGMERLFNFLSLKNQDLEWLRELDCLTTSTYTDLTVKSSSTDILKQHFGLKTVAQIIRRKTTGALHLFVLTDNPNANILTVENLKRDMTINAAVDAGIKVTLYCRARYNSVHRVIEDDQTREHLEVKVVDPSRISVEMLKQHAELHPANYVKIESDATVSSPFNALIVGFDEVGHDALRFLYAFGAFVKSGSNEGERSDFHCDIVDKKIKQKAGLFTVGAPSVSCRMTYCEGNDAPDNSSAITLHDMDVLGVDFYNYLETVIRTLNYVVIDYDDDETNVSLAVRIFRLAVRYREDMYQLRILVRVSNDPDGHLRRITEHYNRLWAAQMSSNGSNHQYWINKEEPIHEPITLFGSMADIFTYDYILNEKLKTEAKHFKQMYDQSIVLLNRAAGGQMPDPLDWDSEHKDLMQLGVRYSPTLSGIMRLRRVQTQNMENCFHKHTKQILAHQALGQEKYLMLSGPYLSRKENETTYTWQGIEPDDTVTRVLDKLAQTEHLRWIASHELLGYSDAGGVNDKDELRLLHGCLKPWNELTSAIQSYDYNVVDVSLGIGLNHGEQDNSGNVDEGSDGSRSTDDTQNMNQ